MIVTLWNRLLPSVRSIEHNERTFIIQPGERIAQYMVVKREIVDYHIVTEFSDTTERGEGRHGSTGRL